VGGAGLSDLPFFPIPNALPVAMWLLAVASVVTVGQRLHAVRTSPGAVDRIELPGSQSANGEPENNQR